MSNPRHEVDRILKDSLAGDSMSEAESQSVWNRIDGSVAESHAPAIPSSIPARRFQNNRFRLVVVAAAAVVLVTVIALSPWNGSDEDKLSFTSLTTASAAEVLNLAAENTVSQPSLVPGPREELYFRLLQTTDMTPGIGGDQPLDTATIEEWIGANGRGVRLDEVSGGSSSSSSGGEMETSPLRTEFDANRIERSLAASDSWRALFTLDQLYAMPIDPRQALAYIRGAIRSGSTKGGVVGMYEAGIVGFDFLVFQSVASMLMQAPLSGEQRSGLFELLADTPEWYSQKGSAGVEVSNRGLSKSGDGQEGILIEADMRLSKMEAAILAGGERSPRFGVLLDPETGSVLETRVVFGQGQSPTLRITSEALETVPEK